MKLEEPEERWSNAFGTAGLAVLLGMILVGIILGITHQCDQEEYLPMTSETTAQVLEELRTSPWATPPTDP